MFAAEQGSIAIKLGETKALGYTSFTLSIFLPVTYFRLSHHHAIGTEKIILSFVRFDASRTQLPTIKWSTSSSEMLW